jgi:ABC-type transport system involved in multi-copper enzyme maturation permease subunit
LPGILTIAKKEFTDHVSDNTFLLSFGVLLIVMVAGTYVHVLGVQDWAYQEILSRDLEEASLAWKMYGPEFTYLIAEPFSFFGILVAIALSFNSLNKERSEGSLKVLLSYPISKGKLIVGKLIGGLLVVTLVTVVSMTICFSIIIYYLGIPVTIDYLSRVVSVTFLGIVLLFFYLCVGTAVSVMITDTSAALMGILLITVALRPDFITMILTIVSGVSNYIGVTFKLPEGISYYPGRNLYWDINTRNFWMMSPSESFLGFSNNIFRFVNPSGYPTVYIPLEFEWLLPKSIDLAQSMIVLVVASFVVCCILFVRREVS